MLTFQVRADSDDDDRKTETTITLDIQDINDNTPIFERNVSFKITEKIQFLTFCNFSYYNFNCVLKKIHSF